MSWNNDATALILSSSSNLFGSPPFRHPGNSRYRRVFNAISSHHALCIHISLSCVFAYFPSVIRFQLISYIYKIYFIDAHSSSISSQERMCQVLALLFFFQTRLVRFCYSHHSRRCYFHIYIELCYDIIIWGLIG